MGLALEIDSSQVPFNSPSISVALPDGSDAKLSRYVGQAVLLFSRKNGHSEVLGCGTLLEISAAALRPTGDFATLDEIRWLANPVEYPMPSGLHWIPWALLRPGDFNLMLCRCKMQHSWGALDSAQSAAAPHFEPAASLKLEVIRRAGGRCQLTRLSGNEGAASADVFATIIRPVAFGGLHNPMNYLALSGRARGAFQAFYLSVAAQNQLVLDRSKIDVDLRDALNPSGYLWRPIDVPERELETNLAWHFGEFIRPLLRPLLI